MNDDVGHPDGVLIADETELSRRTRGRLECKGSTPAPRDGSKQIGVFPAYASPRGRALIDRRQYLPPTSWAADHGRRDTASMPASTPLATKPALTGQMIDAAVQAHVAARWVSESRCTARAQDCAP
ncbi:hypothetical protein Skr01_69540 [Sphaerisporangium krabiense]|uniref:transposase n=1 Tax=Sphaerisporangium krabiense TaxID=763782 RepID=UPI00161B26D5|nr:hypothetical protein Skr01_69540 [Sphaerisporangium krabiense]